MQRRRNRIEMRISDSMSQRTTTIAASVTYAATPRIVRVRPFVRVPGGPRQE
jgi:hypothetical protein